MIISAAIAAAMGIAAAGASAGAKAKARKVIDKKNAIAEGQNAKDQAFFNKEYYKDYTKAADVQDTIRTLSENERIANARTDAQGAITGATDEKIAAGHEANRKRFSDSLASMAAAWGQQKQQLALDKLNRSDRYTQRLLGVKDQESQMYNEEAQQWATTADNSFKQAVNSVGGAVDNGLNKPKAADEH